MKKVLIITYYWPPSGGAGVQRWLKFVKYLPLYNYTPIVYTVENGEYPVIDESLNNDVPKEAVVLKQPIWEPYNFYKRFTGKKKNSKIEHGFLSADKQSGLKKMANKIAVWTRGNFFIPDARMFWIKPSIKYLTEYLRENPVDLIISSGPPHSMHLIAKGLKNTFNIKWIADFRDPWTNIDFYSELMLTPLADARHRKLEKQVLTTADCVLVIGSTMKKEMLALGASKTIVIPNGYDEDDLNIDQVTLDSKFTIAHIGSLVKSRSPAALWEALAQLVSENNDFSNDLVIKLIGKVDINAREAIEQKKLTSFLELIEYLPHKDVIYEQQKNQLLLLILNNTQNAKGIITGKLFEYMASGRPILCIGPNDGDAAEIIDYTQTGTVCDWEDVQKIKATIYSFYLLYKKGELKLKPQHVDEFSRKKLCEKLLKSIQ